MKTDKIKRPFKQVDVFTDRPGFGNPVAVILDAEGLQQDEMQRLAAWTNLSETVFVTKTPGADYHLRIFCPAMELPFAGHPTIGAAHAAMESGLVDAEKPFKQKCGAGLIDLSVKEGIISFKTGVPNQVKADIDIEALGRSISGGALHETMIFDTGPIWMTARVDSVDILNNLIVDNPLFVEVCRESANATGICVFSYRPEGGIEVRTFAPAVGVNEDPVCGSGNLAVAAHLIKSGGLENTGSSYLSRQGSMLGRDGKIHVNVTEEAIEIGGNAVTVFDGIAYI